MLLLLSLPAAEMTDGAIKKTDVGSPLPLMIYGRVSLSNGVKSAG